MRDRPTGPRRRCACAVGIARPSDKNAYGCVSGRVSCGKNESQAGGDAEDIAAQMRASSPGITFDADTNWDEKRQQWIISGNNYNKPHIQPTSTGGQHPTRTTVITAADGEKGRHVPPRVRARLPPDWWGGGGGRARPQGRKGRLGT